MEFNIAKNVAERISKNIKVNVFKNFGTAMFKYKGSDIEFVGARKESYQLISRKPSVCKPGHLKMIRKEEISL